MLFCILFLINVLNIFHLFIVVVKCLECLDVFRYLFFSLCIYLFFSSLKEYSHGQQQKTQEGELKISAVFSVSGSPLGKKQTWINGLCIFWPIWLRRNSACINKLGSSLYPLRMPLNCILHNYYWVSRLALEEKECLLKIHGKK